MIEILSHTTELVDNQIDMRIGIHTVRIFIIFLEQFTIILTAWFLKGKIVCGLVGTQIVRYDIYGVDVMIANKMESNGAKGCIVVS